MDGLQELECMPCGPSSTTEQQCSRKSQKSLAQDSEKEKTLQNRSLLYESVVWPTVIFQNFLHVLET